MAKTGDTVRYLNAIGGGVITRIEGKVAYVEEDGFETPVMLNELVVVMPAGHDAQAAQGHSGRMMFDQKAFDAGRKPEAKPEPEPAAAPEPMPVVETRHGDTLQVTLAFEPDDVKHLSTTKFTAVLVNDSNYYLLFQLARRNESDHTWTTVYSGEVEPNLQLDLARIDHETLGDYGRIAFQCVAFKKEKGFELKQPVSLNLRLDLTKFHKMHCFRPGVYFDTPVLEIPLVLGGTAAERQPDIDPKQLAEAMLTKERPDPKPKNAAKKENRHKLLPLIEVDLHISELVDTTAGMDNSAMLNLQLDTVRRTMRDHSARIGQKIVFIHGKGEGVLRKAVLELLKREYPKAETQDASFREYGFGATLVTIH